METSNTLQAHITGDKGPVTYMWERMNTFPRSSSPREPCILGYSHHQVFLMFGFLDRKLSCKEMEDCCMLTCIVLLRV